MAVLYAVVVEVDPNTTWRSVTPHRSSRRRAISAVVGPALTAPRARLKRRRGRSKSSGGGLPSINSIAWPAGRVYVTTAPARRLSVAEAVNCYRQEWQPEHGFHRLKWGLLAIAHLFLKDDNRIRGLLLLLGIALRVLTLIEFVVRRELAATDETLTGHVCGQSQPRD